MISPVKPVEENIKPAIRLPYPSLVAKKDTKEKGFEKFVKILKNIEIHIPFFEALEKMPLYQKFMKEVLSKKRLTGEGSVPVDEKICTITPKIKIHVK